MILRGLFSIYIILLFANSFIARGNVDSLLAVKANLKTGVFKDDSTRIKIDISLVQGLHPIKDYDSISNFYKELENFILNCIDKSGSSYETGYFKTQYALSKVLKSKFKNANQENEECMQLIDEALIILDAFYENENSVIKDEAYRVSSYLSLIEGSRLIGEQRNTEAIKYLNKGIQTAKYCNCVNEIIKLNTAVGVAYKINGDYNLALDHYFEAVDVSLKNDKTSSLTSIYTNIGIVYKNLLDYNKASEYYTRAMKVSKSSLEYKSIVDLYGSLGVLEKNKKNYDLALIYYDSSFQLADSIGYNLGMISSLSNQANILEKKKEFKSAIKKLKIAEELIDSTNDKSRSMMTKYRLASIYMQLKQFQNAKKYIDTFMNLAYQFENLKDKQNAHELLSIYYEKNNNYKLALEHTNIARKYYDKILNTKIQEDQITKDIEFNYQQKKYADSLENEFLLEAQKRESEIEIDKRDLKLKSSRIQLIIAGVALLLILILSYIIFKRLRITTKQKGIIEEQKDKLSTKNQEIAESVNYAKKIQDTILPSDQTVERIFRKFFILYLPKDIVSGDFYWAADTQDYYFLAVADCTGHGVPGALVSFVCSKALDKAVNEEGLIQTDEILNRTRDVVIEQFSQNNNALNDGMDISLIRVDKIELHTHENVTLQFSGANNPLWIVSKNKNDERFAGFNQREFNENSLIEIKGDKQPIGKFINMQPFNKRELLLKQGELIYLLSDGYADQFGGNNDNGKKYKSAKLKALVSSISKKDLKEQKLHLTRELEEWSRNHEQVDDITIMGIEIR